MNAIWLDRDKTYGYLNTVLSYRYKQTTSSYDIILWVLFIHLIVNVFNSLSLSFSEAHQLNITKLYEWIGGIR